MSATPLVILEDAEGEETCPQCGRPFLPSEEITVVLECVPTRLWDDPIEERTVLVGDMHWYDGHFYHPRCYLAHMGMSPSEVTEYLEHQDEERLAGFPTDNQPANQPINKLADQLLNQLIGRVTKDE